MQDINRVVLIGRLTRDPELRKTQSGTSVCSFTLAVNRRQNQDGTQEADFINCVAWNKLADNIQLYQKKGNQLGIEGRINTRSYDNQQGQKVYVTEVIAENVQFLTPRNDFNEQNTLGVTNYLWHSKLRSESIVWSSDKGSQSIECAVCAKLDSTSRSGCS